MTTRCNAVISLSRPIASERRRGFQPPWYTVYIYACDACGARHTIRAGSFRGTTPEAGIGGIVCNAITTEGE